ncbi:MAG: iron ABC transporter permease [Chthoniobacteraceae bacterium]|nr:iron ABC transporter permease [Chthoniobacteraceae bacterium]
MNRTRAPWGLLSALSAALLLSCVVSLGIGSTSIAWRALWDAAMGHGDPLLRLVLVEIRLPRLLLALLVGGSLGLAGAAMQGLLRNPLVEPGLLGVSSGAGLGAVIAFYLGLSATFAYAVPLGGIAGAALAVVLVCSLAGRDGSIQNLILAGVTVSAICGAFTSLVLNFSPNPYAGMEIVFWLLGSLSDRTFQHVLLAAPLIAAGCALLLGCGDALRAFSLGEETAGSLGFRTGRVRARIIAGAALAVGAAVSVTGCIGFVGLMIPHLLRPLVKGDPARLLPVSALGGALLLLWADILVRVLPTGQELKVGVVTALAGAPIFLFLLVRTRKSLF